MRKFEIAEAYVKARLPNAFVKRDSTYRHWYYIMADTYVSSLYQVCRGTSVNSAWLKAAYILGMRETK